MTGAVAAEERAPAAEPAAKRFVVDLGSRRVLHPGPLRWLRALGWMVLLFFVVGLAAVAPAIGASLLVPELTEVSGAVAVGFSVGMSLTAALVYAGLVWVGEARGPTELSLPPALVQLVIGVLIGAALFAAVMAVMAVGGFYEISPRPVTDAWIATAVTIESGFIEELLLRAIVLRLLWRAFGLGWAVVLSSALFGALHLTNPNASWFAAVCIALEAGLLLGALYAVSGRLWAPIGAHAAWNFTQGWVFGVNVSGMDVFAGGPLESVPGEGASDWITGGAFGAEASLPALAVVGVAAVLLLVLAWRRGLFGRQA